MKKIRKNNKIHSTQNPKNDDGFESFFKKKILILRCLLFVCAFVLFIQQSYYLWKTILFDSFFTPPAFLFSLLSLQSLTMKV